MRRRIVRRSRRPRLASCGRAASHRVRVHTAPGRCRSGVPAVKTIHVAQGSDGRSTALHDANRYRSSSADCRERGNFRPCKGRRALVNARSVWRIERSGSRRRRAPRSRTVSRHVQEAVAMPGKVKSVAHAGGKIVSGAPAANGRTCAFFRLTSTGGIDGCHIEAEAAALSSLSGGNSRRYRALPSQSCCPAGSRARAGPKSI